MSKQIVYGLDELDAVAQKLKHLIGKNTIVTFTGSLGAGKTTLIRSLCASYGIADLVTSPTFSYMHRYKLPDGSSAIHFDLYRLHTASQFAEAGFDEYLDESLVLIEWPEIIEPLLKGRSICQVSIDYEGLEKRKITIGGSCA